MLRRRPALLYLGRMRISHPIASAIASVLVACGPAPAPIARGTSALISDELHNAGTQGFLFLPPMVPAPAVLGDVVSDVPVRITIVQLDAGGKPTRTVRTFDAADPLSPVRFKTEGTRLDPALEDGDLDPVGYYLARWDTEVDVADAIYRVNVEVPARGGGTRVLGFADVDIVRSQREFRSVDRAQYTPLVAGRILRIKFRIDRPAVDGDGDGVFDWLDPVDDRAKGWSSVSGRVRLVLGTRSHAPRALTVWLTRRDRPDESARVKTGLFGDWAIFGALPAGTWSVCSEATDLAPVCDAATFTTSGAPGATKAPEHVRTIVDYVAGRVTLADGKPCVWRFPLHDVEVDTSVTDVDTNRTFETNGAGEFVFFGAGARTMRLHARCEASSVDAIASPGTWTELVLPNRAPHVRGLVARAAGRAIQRLAYDVPLVVRANAVDDDGDALTARWASNEGALAEQGLERTWTPGATTPNLEVLVGDGRGGYDLEPLRLSYSARPPASVRVASDVAGLVARHGAITAAPDADGIVTLGAWDPSAPLVVSAPGFVDRVLIADHGPVEVPLELTSCARTTFDATAGGVVRLPSDPSALAVIFPARALVTADGAPHVGAADVCLAVITASDESPLGGKVADGARVISPVRTAWVDVRDPSSGARLAFAPGAAVRVDLRLTSEELASVGATPRGLSYGDGLWTEGPTPALRLDRVILGLPGPGAVTPASPEAIGCVRLWLGGLQHRSDYALRYRVLGTPASSPVVVPITAGLDLLSPLPANRTVRIEVLDLTSPHHTPIAEWTREVSTGNALLVPVGAGDTFPYDGCGADVVLPPPNAVSGDELLSRFALTKTRTSWGQLVSPAQLASAYYATVDPYGRSAFLLDFWAQNRLSDTNGGPSWLFTLRNYPAALAQRRFDDSMYRVAHGAEGSWGVGKAFQLMMFEHAWDARYFATNDQPLGRPDKTLGIEVRESATTTPRVIFYAFIGDTRVTHIDLDGSGLKPVPAVCMNCHGGDPLDLVAIADHVAQSNTWPATDLGAHTIPFTLDTLRFQDFPGFDRATMENRYRSLASMLLRTPLSPAGRQLIHGAYGSPDPTATSLPPGLVYDDAWAPPGTGAIGWDPQPAVYQQVVGPYCRSCHLQLEPSFTTWDGFAAHASSIEHDVCSSRSMPHAAGTNLAFWTSSPYAPAVLGTALANEPGWTGATCTPP